MDQKLNSIFTLGGGAAGGVTKGVVITAITTASIIEVIIFAAIGATIGWFVKQGLDYLLNKYRNRKG